MQLKPSVKEPDNSEMSSCGIHLLTNLPAIGFNRKYFYYYSFIFHHILENMTIIHTNIYVHQTLLNDCRPKYCQQREQTLTTEL